MLNTSTLTGQSLPAHLAVRFYGFWRQSVRPVGYSSGWSSPCKRAGGMLAAGGSPEYSMRTSSGQDDDRNRCPDGEQNRNNVNPFFGSRYSREWAAPPKRRRSSVSYDFAGAVGGPTRVSC